MLFMLTFFSSFFKPPVELFCCAIFDRPFFVPLVLVCCAEPPKRLSPWKDRECTQPVWCGKPVCAVVWLNSYSLRAVISLDFPSVSLVSHWKFCASGGEGIRLLRISRPAYAGSVTLFAARLPDAASAHGCCSYPWI